MASDEFCSSALICSSLSRSVFSIQELVGYIPGYPADAYDISLIIAIGVL